MGDTDAIWRMLKARRVAVVGASQDPHKFSGVLVPSILAGGFTGEVIPVNPRADMVAGLKCYPSVSDIPGTLDLVVIAVPAKFVPGVLHEAADKGAAGAIVISAGGRESGKPEFDKEIAADRAGARPALLRAQHPGRLLRAQPAVAPSSGRS